jgi:hypothetical protein
MLHDTAQEEVYKPQWARIVLGPLLFGLGAVGLGFAAATNHRGMTVYRVIQLEPSVATIVYWIACAVCACWFVASLLMSYRLLSLHRQEIRNRRRRRKARKTKSQ